MTDHGILNIFELHVYDCTKFALRSLRKEQPTEELNDILKKSTHRYNTRQKELYRPPNYKTRSSKVSLAARCTKLINYILSNKIADTEKLKQLLITDEKTFLHQFAVNHISQNENLIHLIFR